MPWAETVQTFGNGGHIRSAADPPDAETRVADSVVDRIQAEGYNRLRLPDAPRDGKAGG